MVVPRGPVMISVQIDVGSVVVLWVADEMAHERIEATAWPVCMVA